MDFKDIPVMSVADYKVSISWEELAERWVKAHGTIRVELQPDFQRGYVWTQEQQISYVENMLKGAVSGRDVYFNHPTWGSFEDADKYPLQCVDGQQRIGAVLAFMENRLPIFGGNYFKDISGSLPWTNRARFTVYVNNLKSRKDVIQWYLDLNTGGTVHSDEELERVRGLLAVAD